jgi:hypothetical protein
VTGRICPVYLRLRNSIFTQPLLISNCSNFVRAFSRSIWWWHDACATTAMQARAPARTPPQVSSVVIRDDSRLECSIVFVPSERHRRFGQSILAYCGQPPVLARDEHVSRRNAKPRLVASARHPYTFHVRPFNSEPQSRRGINNAPKPLKKGVCCGSSAAFFARDCNHCSGNNIRGSS